MTRNARLIGLATIWMALSGGVPAASAGTYKSYSCHTPSGAAADTVGWSTLTTAEFSSPTNTCSSGSGGYLEASLNVQAAISNGGQSSWLYTPPAGTKIRHTKAWRYALAQRTAAAGYGWPVATIVDADTSYQGYYYSRLGQRGVGDSAQPLSAANVLEFDSPNGSAGLAYNVVCDGGQCGPNQPDQAGMVRVYAQQETIEDTLDPTPSGAAGPLTAGGAHAGTDAIEYDATDLGAGVYRSIVEIDGQPAQTEVVDTNGGRCQDAGEDPASPYEFKTGGVPCKLSKHVTQAVDTAAINDGAHALKVLVEDAAGNRTSVFFNDSFVVDNLPGGAPDPPLTPVPTPLSGSAGGRGAANGAGASESAKLSAFSKASRSALSLRYGKTAEIQGRLTDEHGRAITGAQVEVLARTKGADRFAGESAVTTGRDGRYSYHLAIGSSRTVRFAYRAFTGDHDFADTRDIEVSVRAGLALKRNPRKLRNGETVRFSGRLLGGPMPTRGLLVDLQARVGRHWRTFAVMRTQSNGRYQYVYRFTRTTQTLTYKFRARARGDSAYPYELGVSNRVKVKVRGG